MFSVIVAKVTENPQPGSDEIDKAFDEGWIGTKGYRRVMETGNTGLLHFRAK